MIESAVPSCLALTLTAKARTAAPEFVIPPMPVFKGAIISDGRTGKPGAGVTRPVNAHFT